MAWTKERVKLLTEMWTKGLSASECALRLGTTRNAICGKVDRLSLPQRDSKRARTWRRKKDCAPSVRGKTVIWGTGRDHTEKLRSRLRTPPTLDSTPVPLPAADDIPTKTFDELERNDGCCRWRVDKPIRNQPYGFCGKETLPGLSICHDHAARQFRNWAEIAPKYVKARTEKAKEAEPA